ncbi:hypothetical protein EON80_06745 [bacterium]|nr:MAG: hypothetical protein EON80_06745 [bacterium]
MIFTPQYVFTILVAILAAWGHSAIFYGLFRWIEARWLAFPKVGSVLLVLYLNYELASWSNPGMQCLANQPLIIISLFAIALLGGWFHRLSGGASKSGPAAFFLMLELAICCLWSESLFPVARWLRSLGLSPSAISFYELGTIYYPALVPLALWIWQKSRIVPGVDEPFADN